MPRQKFFKLRLFKRQQIWTLTLTGWLVLIAISVIFCSLVATHIQPFLAVNRHVSANVLVVEGWIPDFALKQAYTEAQKPNYQQIFTTGIPVERGSYLSEYKTYAQVGAATLKAQGLAADKLIVVPTPDAIKDRTYASVVAVKQLITKSNLSIKAINVFTADVHARRSWMIYKKVLGQQIQVGIIAAPSGSYNPQKWWASSEGFRLVISETVAYLYALFAY